ncbi:MAG: hypothetical protein ACXU8U_04335 [Asticcacaulis sp.]
MKKIVLGVVAALTLAGGVAATSMAVAHNVPSCFCDKYGCVCE